MTHNKRRRTLREPDRTAEFMAKGYAIDACPVLPMGNDVGRAIMRDKVAAAFLAGYRAARKSQRGGK